MNDFLVSSEQAESVQFPASYTTNTSFNEGSVAITFSVTNPPTPKKFKFTAVPEPYFTKIPHVAQVLSQPKLMLSPSQLEMPVLPGEMTTNQIKDHRGQAAFNCKIVHSAEGLLSAVEILDIYNNLEATAHVLSVGALPETDEVSNEGKDCVTVTGREGARAILIRTRDDDCGICVGKWIKKEVKRRRERNISLSFMGIKYYNLTKPGQGWCKVKKLKESKFLVALSSKDDSSVVAFKVDLGKGTITLPNDGADVIPQCLAIGFAISVLHLLCRPYSPKPDQRAAPLSRRVNHSSRAPIGATAGTRYRRRSLSNNSLVFYTTPALFLAAGYMSMTVPTNMYLMSCPGTVGWDFCPDIDASDGFHGMDCDGEWEVILVLTMIMITSVWVALATLMLILKLGLTIGVMADLKMVA